MMMADEPRFTHGSAQHCNLHVCAPQTPARPSSALLELWLELWLGLPVLLAVEPNVNLRIQAYNATQGLCTGLQHISYCMVCATPGTC